MASKAIRVELAGLSELRKKMRRYGLDGTRAFNGAIYAEELHVLRNSVKRTPVVSSRLRNSQFATVPFASAVRADARCGYGVIYAYRVHEGITTKVKDLPRAAQKAFWGHVAKQETVTSGRSGGSITFLTWKTSDVGGPKFLQNALNATAGSRFKRIARTTHRYLEQKRGVRVSANMPDSVAAARAAANSKAKV